MNPIPVSRGTGPEVYCLLVPIWFSDIHTFSGFDSDVIRIPGKSVSVRENNRWLELEVRPFETPEAARTAFAKITAAIFRAIAGRRVSAIVAPLAEIEREYPRELVDNFERSTYEPWPRREPETDGVVHGGRSYVIPDNERILLWPSGWGRAVRPITPATLTEWLASGEKPRRWPISEQEALAISIVAEASSQRNRKLEFLGFVNALEVLIESKTLTALQSEFVGKWKEDLSKSIEEAVQSGNPAKADEMRDIHGRLAHINDSVQMGLRRLLARVPPIAVIDDPLNIGFESVPDLPAAIGGIYAVRSELTHNGQVRDKAGVSGRERLEKSASQVRYLVYCILSDRLQ